MADHYVRYNDQQISNVDGAGLVRLQQLIRRDPDYLALALMP